MPAWLSGDEGFQNLLYVGSGHVAMVNDLFSYRVERKRMEQEQGGLMYNSVSFLSQKVWNEPGGCHGGIEKVYFGGGRTVYGGVGEVEESLFLFARPSEGHRRVLKCSCGWHGWKHHLVEFLWKV